jgi:hypothetical protein
MVRSALQRHNFQIKPMKISRVKLCFYKIPISLKGIGTDKLKDFLWKSYVETPLINAGILFLYNTQHVSKMLGQSSRASFSH